MALKINLEIMQAGGPPEGPDEMAAYRRKVLEDKIDYAVECIEYELDNAPEALRFLQRLDKRIRAQRRVEEEDLYLLDKIAPTLGMYGTYQDSEACEHGYED